MTIDDLQFGKLAAPFGAVAGAFQLAFRQMKHFVARLRRAACLGVALAKTEAQRAKKGAEWIHANACTSPSVFYGTAMIVNCTSS